MTTTSMAAFPKRRDQDKAFSLPQHLKDVRIQFVVPREQGKERWFRDDEPLDLTDIPTGSMQFAEDIERDVRVVLVQIVEEDRLKANLPNIPLPLATAIVGQIPETRTRLRYATSREYKASAGLKSIPVIQGSPALRQRGLQLEVVNLQQYLVDLASQGKSEAYIRRRLAEVSYVAPRAQAEAADDLVSCTSSPTTAAASYSKPPLPKSSRNTKIPSQSSSPTARKAWPFPLMQRRWRPSEWPMP